MFLIASIKFCRPIRHPKSGTESFGSIEACAKSIRRAIGGYKILIIGIL